MNAENTDLCKFKRHELDTDGQIFFLDNDLTAKDSLGRG